VRVKPRTTPAWKCSPPARLQSSLKGSQAERLKIKHRRQPPAWLPSTRAALCRHQRSHSARTAQPALGGPSLRLKAAGLTTASAAQSRSSPGSVPHIFGCRYRWLRGRTAQLTWRTALLTALAVCLNAVGHKALGCNSAYMLTSLPALIPQTIKINRTSWLGVF